MGILQLHYHLMRLTSECHYAYKTVLAVTDPEENLQTLSVCGVGEGRGLRNLSQRWRHAQGPEHTASPPVRTVCTGILLHTGYGIWTSMGQQNPADCLMPFWAPSFLLLRLPLFPFDQKQAISQGL